MPFAALVSTTEPALATLPVSVAMFVNAKLPSAMLPCDSRSSATGLAGANLAPNAIDVAVGACPRVAPNRKRWVTPTWVSAGLLPDPPPMVTAVLDDGAHSNT